MVAAEERQRAVAPPLVCGGAVARGSAASRGATGAITGTRSRTPRGAGDRMAVASLSPYVTRRGRAVPFRAFAGDDLLRFFTVCETAGMLG